MKKRIIYCLCILLIVTGCAQKEKEEVVQKDDEKEEEQTPSIVPSHQLSKDTYQTVLPFRPSEARGLIGDQIANRLDIEEVEEGLRRHSKEVFDPKDYYYEDGQYLDEETIERWIGRKLSDSQLKEETKKQVDQLEEAEQNPDEEKIKEELQEGLNPTIEDDGDKKAHEESPKYLSHIVEQNYLKKKGDNKVELEGVSIGLALKSVYRYQTETGGPYYYEDISTEEMMEKGTEIAKKVIKRMRKIEGLEDVPIMIALYREEEQSSPVPGNFVAKTLVDKGEDELGKWEKLDEEYVLFPSDHAKDKYYEDAEVVSSFGKKIGEYFPNYVGTIGEGLYIDEELKRLTIEIPIQFYGKSEVIGFTQYAYGLVKEMFSDFYDLEIKVTSSDRMESVIYREAGTEDPVVHIFH